MLPNHDVIVTCNTVLFLFQNLTKDQADYCIARMKPFVDKTGREVPDSYDFADFTQSMFVN